MRVLVTGADGFVGQYLVERLLDKGYQVIAGTRYSNYKLKKSTEIGYFNLGDQESIYRLLEEKRPQGIIHLAAQSMVKVSWEEPDNTLLMNTVGTLHLAMAMKEFTPKAKLLSVGSSEEYGLSAKCGELLTEEHPCFPNNPYATSKLAAGNVLLQLAKKEKLDIIHVRPFNHFGPGQRQGFVVSDFASQIANIEKKAIPAQIKVGDLSARRDFIDVRDVVDAYLALLENNVEVGIYNICSGIARSIEDILTFLLAQARIPVEVVVDHEKFRPSEVPIFVGSPEKIQKAIGWRPHRSFEKTLLESLNWWRQNNELHSIGG